MNLVILGANGRTGRIVVREALADGATVTGVVRSDARRPEIQHDRLRTAIGDPCDPAFLANVFRGQDAVISTLGGRSPTKRATSIYWRSAEAITDAARDVGLKRVVVTSSALLFPRRRLVDKVLAAVVPNVIRSAARMEKTLEEARLDVVVARCGFLTDLDARGYRAELGSLPVRGSSVPRLGLARFLLDQAGGVSSGHRVHGVSGPAR